jgi:D-amino peptidase
MLDMEGISGIHLTSQVKVGDEQYKNVRKFLTWDVNSCIGGCFLGGATEVQVKDAHCSRDNFIWGNLIISHNISKVLMSFLI